MSQVLTTLVNSTDDIADQNTDNIQVVSTVVSETAILISNPSVATTIDQETIVMVKDSI